MPAHGTTRYLCPVRCGWHHDVPPPSVTDMTDLADEATLRTAATTEAALVAHLDTHTTIDFVTALEGLHAEIQRLTAAQSDAAPTTEES